VIFGTAYLMTRDRESAEDAVQNSLVQMWNHISALRLRSSLKAWLLRIVVNEVNQQRRKKRLPTFSAEEVEDLTGDPDETETIVDNRERHRNLKQALEMLPEIQREMIVLRYFSELTVPEIASVTGIQEGTIKSRLSRALDRLGEILGNEDEAGEAKR
jgi:RNA polymerase sigma-70 factor (ECF subfamily)